MSLIQTRLSKLAFGTAKKKDIYKDATLKMIDATLNTKQARKTIHKVVGRNVDKAVVINDLHSSPMDSKRHYTLDLYSQLEPVGCAHIYRAGEYQIFDARKKAKKAFSCGIRCPESS